MKKTTPVSFRRRVIASLVVAMGSWKADNYVGQCVLSVYVIVCPSLSIVYHNLFELAPRVSFVIEDLGLNNNQ
jgi:hypothetical protein